MEGANPFDGTVGQVQTRPEVKMEFRIKEEEREEVQRIIDRVHPYEVPVVNYIPLAECDDFSKSSKNCLTTKREVPKGAFFLLLFAILLPNSKGRKGSSCT